MENPKIKALFYRYIKRECTKEEIQELVSYFQDSEELPDFPTIDEVGQLLEDFPNMDDATANRMYDNIVGIRKKEKKRLYYSAIAAVFIGLFTLGLFYQQGFFSDKSDNLLIPKEEHITLRLDNGAVEILDPTTSKEVLNGQGAVIGNQSKAKLVYKNGSDSDELVYNILTVPYGKRFHVVLSDGTQVYLNAGTQFKYPIQFLSKGERKVFIAGEAYFDVTTDNARPFIVNAQQLDVSVLGTEFNVFAYPEDALTNVVLVEGKVALGLEDSKGRITLNPGEKGVLERGSDLLSKEKVNTEIYTAWREGELVFRRMTFENLVKKLERHYNVSIIIQNESLKHEVFSASFNNETIETVLGYLNDSYNIEYRIENNTVFIQ